MYDNWKKILPWIFTLGLVWDFVGLIHLGIFPRYVNTILVGIPDAELAAGTLLLYFSLGVHFVIDGTPDGD
jgi:hypothetical protein